VIDLKRTLQELAALVGGDLVGQADIYITGVTGIEEAGPNQVTFALGGAFLEKAAISNAAAVIVPKEITEFPKPILRVDNPKAVFAQLLELFTPPPKVVREIHASCVIAQTARIGANVALMPNVVVGEKASIGANTIIYPGVYIAEDVTIGENCLIYPNVTIREGCKIGNNVIIHSSTVIGSDGFGFVTIDGRHRKVPQVGIVVVEDDVEIGACVTIDRATTSETVVRRGTKIDNLVHLAHNVVVGEDCFLCAQIGIAGSAKIGHHVTFAGQSGAAGHLKIGDHCVLAARCGATHDLPDKSFYAGFPGRPHKEWLRAEAGVYKLPDMLKKVKDLEKRLAELEKNM
jgi:UDP-3-O-[3-hydroxymyristoyl] glucosamine N-acyltransferase